MSARYLCRATRRALGGPRGVVIAHARGSPVDAALNRKLRAGSCQLDCSLEHTKEVMGLIQVMREPNLGPHLALP